MESQEQSIEETLAPKIIKGLASSNPSIRSKSLKSLINYLSSQTLIPDPLFKKLWKSLFYCLWHSDKIQNQTHLVNLLSSLVTSLSFPLSLSYFSHFLITMRREWPGIDHLRLDKFYLLVRCFVRDLFVLMRDLNWDLCVFGGFIRVLEKDGFLIDGVGDDLKWDNLGANGVGYHIVSVFIDEIKPFLPLNVGVLDLLFGSFFRVLSRSHNKVLVSKVKANVFDCLLKFGRDFLELKKKKKKKNVGPSEVDDDDDNGDVVLFGTIALGMGFAKRFLELGSSEECVQANRKVVFGLHEEFLKLEKERDSLGLEVSLPEVVDDDHEVPKLIPITNNHNVGMHVEVDSKKKNKKGSKDKKSKKKNKDKNEGSSNGDMEIEVDDKMKKELEKEKKSKKQKKDKNESGSNESVDDDDDEMVSVADIMNADDGGDGASSVDIDETMIHNLQQQFDRIAADCGLSDGDGEIALGSSPITTVQVKGKCAKKRKRSKSVDNGVDEAAAPETEKSGKRVSFALKDNIVWKTQNPMPPQSVRIPPSSTPRGSALKKGLSPGPIREVRKMTTKKKPSPMKKAKKVKSISPSKRAKKKKKVKAMSA